MFPSSLGFSFFDSTYLQDASLVAGLNLLLLQPPLTKRFPFHHLQPFASFCRRAIWTRASPDPLSVAVPLNLLILDALNVFPMRGRPTLLTGAVTSTPPPPPVEAGREARYSEDIPSSLTGPTLFPLKSLFTTTVPWQFGLAMLSPYFWVFTAWVSVARLFMTVLSSQVTESVDVILMPSLPETSSELFVTVLPSITFRSPLVTFSPSWPAWSMTFPMTMFALDFLFG